VATIREANRAKAHLPGNFGGNCVAILKTRTRLVYFRISEDEFEQFGEICARSGARSISDLARMAIQQLMTDGAAPATAKIDKALDRVAGALDDLETRLGRVSASLATVAIEPEAMHTSGHEAFLAKDFNGGKS
jgi:predicted HAD superfamily Cof-like phosphohydrolase